MKINVYQTEPRGDWSVELVPETGKSLVAHSDCAKHDAEYHARHWVERYKDKGHKVVVFTTTCEEIEQ